MRRFLSDSTVKLGDAIASVDAFAAIVDDSHLRLACSSCFCLHDERSLRQCSGCKVLKYCSAYVNDQLLMYSIFVYLHVKYSFVLYCRACQRNDWVEHAAECKALVATKVSQE